MEKKKITDEALAEQPNTNESAAQEVSQLIQEIDSRIYRFIELTGASGKVVKKRWRDIKKSRTAK